jgi:hypothetical protein
MRDEIIEKIRLSGLGSLGVSNELPFDDNGQALFNKNSKQVYVDNPQTSQEPLFQTLNGGCNVNNSTTTVSVFFAVDAKNKPADYETNIAKLQSVKDSVTFEGSTSRLVFTSTEYAGDLLISEIEYEFTRIT